MKSAGAVILSIVCTFFFAFFCRVPAIAQEAKLNDVTIQTFDVGGGPWGLAFDGTNVWSANSWGNTVTKLRASDGALVGVIMTGNNPLHLAFDGTNMWVTNYDDDTVSKVLASDGTVLGTYPVAWGPYGVVFDGTNVWVSCQTGGAVLKLRGTDGEQLAKVGVPGYPEGLAFDGSNVWVANSANHLLTKIRASDATVVGTVDVGMQLRELLYYGNKLWGTPPRYNVPAENMIKVRLRDDNVQVILMKGSPAGMTFDGKNIWVARFDFDSVVRLAARNGERRGSIDGLCAWGILFDGTNLWTSDWPCSALTKISKSQ